MTCERCETALEFGDLRCAVCALPAPVDELPPDPDAPVRARILRCTECNAAVAFVPALGAPHCAFCNAVTRIEQPIDPIEVARLRLPFTVSREVAEAALRNWLRARGWFAPAQLSDLAVVESLHPLCWAGWLVTADATVAWTADSNSGAMRSDWAPHAGETRMSLADIVVPASRGLTHVECRALVPHYDLGSAVIVTPDIGGEPMSPETTVESFDAQRSAARVHVHRAIEQIAAVRVERLVPGTRFRKIRVACMLEDQRTDRVAFPAWVLVYRYRDRAYRAVIHGQRPEVVVGKTPIDWGKIAKLAGAIATTIAIIAALALLLTGCDSTPPAPPDARDFTERCTPDGTKFAPLTGRAAVQGILNVRVDAGGLVMADTTSSILIAMDLDQQGTNLGVTAQVCAIRIPTVPVPGQEQPISLAIPDATVLSVGTVTGTGTLASPDDTCAEITTAPITLVLGSKLATPTTSPLISVANDGSFPACAGTTCTDATGIDCACDQEADGKPGATLLAANVPAVDLDEVYANLRTTFSLRGAVFGTDSVKGAIDASLEQGILGCRLTSGNPCINNDLRVVRNLNPVVTQQEGNPSTFRAVRIPPGTPCETIVRDEPLLFPR